MEVIALTGTYDPEIKAMIAEMVPEGFKLKIVSSLEEYDQLQEANYIILRILGLNEQHINSLPNLKLIQRWGVGYEKVDVKAATKNNVAVAVTSGMNATSVSEMATLLMLSVYRQVLKLHDNVVNGKWQEGGFGSFSYTLDNKKVGLVGLGAIGKLVAKKVQAFGAEVQYYDLFRLSEADEAKLGLKYVELNELFKTSDVISLHVPVNDSTKHLVRKETIELMKPTAIIINTARGQVIKEDDLVEALKTKRILGAGLDCLEIEPPAKDNPVLTLENVVLTPHMGGSTSDINLAMAKRCIENIVKISKGQDLLKTDLVNPECFPIRKA